VNGNKPPSIGFCDTLKYHPSLSSRGVIIIAIIITTRFNFRYFIVYNFINDLVDNYNNGSDIFLYADDAKLFRHITCNNVGDLLQRIFLIYKYGWKSGYCSCINNVRYFHMVIKLTFEND